MVSPFRTMTIAPVLRLRDRCQERASDSPEGRQQVRMVQGSNPPLCSLQNVAPSNIVTRMENGQRAGGWGGIQASFPRKGRLLINLRKCVH